MNAITIMVFRTNIKTKKKLKHISSFFNNHSNIHDWSVDIEDIDNVLRIEANGSITKTGFINELKAKGVYCETLSD
ncbi:hypothetical protein KFZ70_10445 [Tamlana fucoidanivorans]|uniref:Uncharacterized protein n=1 Tax=Allotamlana fucoidanivorans TaxID=2583814 RepID=A0A5C4SNG6_9FLAO|nr:hypothetical protein [Tamlana fucoidanivorans]TNJ45719.1 hypothetical protein FGF67_04880 [Tamlana fucoidanivorans]